MTYMTAAGGASTTIEEVVCSAMVQPRTLEPDAILARRLPDGGLAVRRR